MIELLEDEEIHMSPKQMTEILNLVTKEEIIEMEEKVEKALGQTKTAAAHIAAAVSNIAQRSSTPLSIEEIPIKEADSKETPPSVGSSNKEEADEKKRASAKQQGSP